MAEWPFGKQAALKLAERSINYYQNLVDEHGAVWLLGLFMAKQWQRLLNEASDNLEELQLLARTMEAERMNQGSEWHHMWNCVKNRITEGEQQKTNR